MASGGHPAGPGSKKPCHTLAADPIQEPQSDRLERRDGPIERAESPVQILICRHIKILDARVPQLKRCDHRIIKVDDDQAARISVSSKEMLGQDRPPRCRCRECVEEAAQVTFGMSAFEARIFGRRPKMESAIGVREPAANIAKTEEEGTASIGVCEPDGTDAYLEISKLPQNTQEIAEGTRVAASPVDFDRDSSRELHD